MRSLLFELSEQRMEAMEGYLHGLSFSREASSPRRNPRENLRGNRRR